MNYQAKKQSIRDNCIELFFGNADKVQYFSEIIDQMIKFEKLAKRYGLIREFKENGLI